MELSLAFKIFNALAAFGWLLLIAAPRSMLAQRLVFKPVIPIVLSAGYLLFLFLGRSAFTEGGGFGSLEAVSILFRHPIVLTAGWIHYLAFDLLIGTGIARDAQAYGTRRWITAPILFLTFMFGPVGWLASRFLKPKV